MCESVPLADKLKEPVFRSTQPQKLIGPQFRYTHKHSLERIYDALKTNTAYMKEREKVSA